ncbi:nuclear transport factor 2 family protein [Robertmurraya andreesenii]|uniref:SnoaL-like aldol condensation-catalyzing enzyme n=1 Tax=Anoxybacillus andreesenii TaxID=1325932 RepID=A0ABT9V6Z3_9BACL|nr:nuclear transport factor 2 family protein [Robertmurraya andreesenii]MDQ0156716.1 putative SnoaL-like aldol condensation-catalyzing enzyme [Robertmurraya andreesenii]
MSTEKNFSSNESLKEKAVAFLQLVASGRVREAYETYIGSDFRHHNPYFGGDASSLMAGMEESAKDSPNKIFAVKQAIQEGTTVAVHSHLRQNPTDRGAAVVHIFRFHDNKIVELWDIGQPIPEDSLNEHGMF